MGVATAFYEDITTDSLGRSLNDIWGFGAKQLETDHDYIQWLFPLPEPSQFNRDAPVLTEADIAAFSEAEIRTDFEKSYRLMLHFYGFKEEADEVKRDNHYAESIKNWVTPGNHNFLRLTRIMKSLSLLGLKDKAKNLLTALEDVYAEHGEVIGKTSLEFWRNAVVTNKASGIHKVPQNG